MRQIKTFSDERLNYFCAYCGGRTGTRDHVPSKILLDKPYPENLPVVPACLKCNSGFSLDEEYFACLLECVLCGTTEPKELSRIRISKILIEKPYLKTRLERSKNCLDGSIDFEIEEKRVENVLIKLAKGHHRFENSDSQIEEPDEVQFKAVEMMNNEEMEDFLGNIEQAKSPEIGSRAFHDFAFNVAGVPVSNWKEVQPNNYQYCVSYLNATSVVKIVIWNYLACKIVWY